VGEAHTHDLAAAGWFATACVLVGRLDSAGKE
jgi:hypothetical protein